MAIATGVAKVVAIKKETLWGVAAGTGGGKQLRRVTCTIGLKKQTYESQEIRTDYQVADMRHGVRSVDGALDGELSPGSYQDVLAGALRKVFAGVAAIAGLTLTIAGAGPIFTVTRSAVDWLTSGVKVGMVVRITAGAFNAANSNKNLFVLALTPTVMTVMALNGVALVAEGPIATATVTVPGMKCFVPTSGHTDDSFTIEQWFADVAQSELFLGNKVQTVDIDLPPTGMAKIKSTFMGRDVLAAIAQYFVAPAAPSTAGVLAAVNGAVMANGAIVALLTGMKFAVGGNQSAEPVVGSNLYPDIQEGRVRVSGEMTVMFQDAVFRDYFWNETEVAIAMAFSTSNAAAAEFVAFSFARVKFGDSTKNDGERALIQTMPFTALIPATGGSGFDREQSTILIHDSLAV